jgi:membrane protein involved in colicin uptake
MNRMQKLQADIAAAKAAEEQKREKLKQQREQLRRQHTEELKELRQERLSKEREIRRQRQKAMDHAIYQVAGECIRVYREEEREEPFTRMWAIVKKKIDEGSYRGDSKDLDKLKLGMRLLGNRLFENERK